MAPKLSANALEKALEVVCAEQSEAPTASPSMTMISGHENIAGVDPDFAAHLHDKLAEKTDKSEQNGLRAPCTTLHLSMNDLSQLDDEEAEDGVIIDKKDHGKIDHVDSKLVTELNRRLCDEISHKEQPKNGAVEASFAAALGSKLDDLEVVDNAQFVAATHGAISKIDDNLVLELQRKLAGAGEAADPEEAAHCKETAEKEPEGMRAPMNTRTPGAMMSLLQNLDQDPEEGENEHAPIDAAHPGLLAQLQQRLEADADDPEESVCKVGCRAPQCTVKLSKEMLEGLDDDDEDVKDVIQAAAINVAPAVAAAECPLLAAAAKLNEEAAAHEEDHDRGGQIFDAAFAAQLHHQLAGQSGDHHSGLDAPEPTKMLTADMLAGIDDDDEVAQGADLCSQLASKLEACTLDGDGEVASRRDSGSSSKDGKGGKAGNSKRVVGFSAGENNDNGFADALSAKLANADDKVGSPPGDDDDDIKFEAGRRAPQTTQVLSMSQLSALDAEEENNDDPLASAAALLAKAVPDGCESFEDGDEVTLEKFAAGMKAPQCTAVLSADQLAMLDDDVELMDDPSLNAQVSPQQVKEREFAAKVIQDMQGLPNGNSKPVSSSCKMRLAWLSDEEIRNENDQIRREIASLRSQIEMHRRQASLANKA